MKRYIVLGILGMLSGGGGGYAVDHGAYATGVSFAAALAETTEPR